MTFARVYYYKFGTLDGIERTDEFKLAMNDNNGSDNTLKLCKQAIYPYKSDQKVQKYVDAIRKGSCTFIECRSDNELLSDGYTQYGVAISKCIKDINTATALVIAKCIMSKGHMIPAELDENLCTEYSHEIPFFSILPVERQNILINYVTKFTNLLLKNAIVAENSEPLILNDQLIISQDVNRETVTELVRAEVFFKLLSYGRAALDIVMSIVNNPFALLMQTKKNSLFYAMSELALANNKTIKEVLLDFGFDAWDFDRSLKLTGWYIVNTVEGLFKIHPTDPIRFSEIGEAELISMRRD